MLHPQSSWIYSHQQHHIILLTDAHTSYNTQNSPNYTHTHAFNGPFSGTTQVSRYQKGGTNLDFTEARDNEWQWHQLGHMQVCTLLLPYGRSEVNINRTLPNYNLRVMLQCAFSALTLLVEWWGAGVVICLEQSRLAYSPADATATHWL